MILFIIRSCFCNVVVQLSIYKKDLNVFLRTEDHSIIRKEFQTGNKARIPKTYIIKQRNEQSTNSLCELLAQFNFTTAEDFNKKITKNKFKLNGLMHQDVCSTDSLCSRLNCTKTINHKPYPQPPATLQLAVYWRPFFSL